MLVTYGTNLSSTEYVGKFTQRTPPYNEVLSTSTIVAAGGCSKKALAIQASNFPKAFVIVSGRACVTSSIFAPPMVDGVNVVMDVEKAFKKELTNPTFDSSYVTTPSLLI